MEKKQLITIKKGFTHAGAFHADDVLSSALLMILNPEIKIERGYTVPENYDGLVFDIGFGKYDHHQKEKKKRKNGIAYAAFGLLWKEYGTLILSEREAELFDSNFVQSIDSADNYGTYNVLSECIADRNPVWNQKMDSDIEFLKTVLWAKEILEHKFAQINSRREAYEIVSEQITNAENQILYLEKFVPWKEKIVETDILYVIYKSSRGGYNIQASPVSVTDKTLRKAFPESWRGLCDFDIQKETGVSDAVYCHPSGFLAVARSLEGARELARIAKKA